MKRRTIGAAAGLGIAGAAGAAIYGGQYPTAQIYGSTICRNPDAGRKIALTYDDGPNPAYTPKLLALLDRFGARATFFSIGTWAEREPGLLRELQAAGHAIGNHTHTHPTMPLLRREVKEELRRCRAAVEAAGLEFARGPRGDADATSVRPPPPGDAAGDPRGGLSSRSPGRSPATTGGGRRPSARSPVTPPTPGPATSSSCTTATTTCRMPTAHARSRPPRTRSSATPPRATSS